MGRVCGVGMYPEEEEGIGLQKGYKEVGAVSPEEKNQNYNPSIETEVHLLTWEHYL